MTYYTTRCITCLDFALYTEGKRKRQYLVVKTVCLDKPSQETIPTRDVLARLSTDGFGSPWWMTKECPAEFSLDQTSAQFHFILECIYPALRGKPVELCIGGGKNQRRLIPLPHGHGTGYGHRPATLKEKVGKGQLYIRPKSTLASSPCRESRVSVHSLY